MPAIRLGLVALGPAQAPPRSSPTLCVSWWCQNLPIMEAGRGHVEVLDRISPHSTRNSPTTIYLVPWFTALHAHPFHCPFIDPCMAFIWELETLLIHAPLNPHFLFKIYMFALNLKKMWLGLRGPVYGPIDGLESCRPGLQPIGDNKSFRRNVILLKKTKQAVCWFIGTKRYRGNGK